MESNVLFIVTTKSSSEDIAIEKVYEIKMNRFSDMTESMKNNFAENKKCFSLISFITRFDAE